MLDNVDNDIELTEDVFLLSLEQLEAKNKDKYKFIIVRRKLNPFQGSNFL